MGQDTKTDASGNKNVTKTDASGNTFSDASGNKNVTKTDVSGNTFSDASGNNEVTNIFSTLFSQSNVILIIWFLAIYFILYLILGIFYKQDGSTGSTMLLSLSFDFLILVFVVIFIFFSFNSKSPTAQSSAIKNTIVSYKDYLNKPISIFSISLFLFMFYILIYLFGIPMSYGTKPIFISLIENFAWITFSLLLFVSFFKYVLGVSIIDDISTWVSNWWNGLPQTSPTPTVDISNNDVQKSEVFNVSNNLYTYDDAKSICSSYGAQLANYDQIETAYQQGGEWCNYGWSDGQMIFFPTQKSTWQKLQQDDKTKNNCGRPGINGGYIANPYVKFGVNCYGKKPKPTDKNLAMMKAQAIVPKNTNDVALDKKVKFWKENADKILNINSFNNNKWSEY